MLTHSKQSGVSWDDEIYVQRLAQWDRTAMYELTWITTRQEGPFLERKSCYGRSGDRPGRRPVRDVERHVAEALASDRPAYCFLLENLGSFAKPR